MRHGEEEGGGKSERGPSRVRSRGAVGSGTLESLALELYGVIRERSRSMGSHGANNESSSGNRSENRGINPVSLTLLEQIRPLGELMTSWFEEVPYIDAAGKPRVLKIEGRGATFESLAKRFLPGMPLAEVVALAGRTANVGTLSGGRIALYGDTMVNLSKNRDAVLAQNILHVRQIFDTCLYNAQRDSDDGMPGRLERMVSNVLSTKEFEKFQGRVAGSCMTYANGSIGC